jgi:site-specific DNA recombinase
MKAIGYVRVSTDKQVREGVSVENQVERIKEFCDRDNLELVDIIRDEGISGGKNRTRKGFVNLLEKIETDEIDAVVLYSLERLSRDMLTILSLERYLDEFDVTLYTVEGKIDTSTIDGWMSFSMKAFMGEMERRQVRSRTKKAMEHMKKNGRVVGDIPFGFEREGDLLVEIPGEQSIITQINEMYSHGMNLSSIVRTLNRDGITTRSGNEWDTTQVRRLIDGYKPTRKRRKTNHGETIKEFILSME